MSHTFFVNSFSISLYLILRLSSISFSFDGNFSTLRIKAIFSSYIKLNILYVPILLIQEVFFPFLYI